MTSSGSNPEATPLWRDSRFWRIALQVLVIAIVVVVAMIMLSNLNRNLTQLGRRFEFSFLWNRAGFNIGESLIPYQVNDTYFWAFFVGIVNSIRLVLVCFVITTVIGIVAGIASFSDNWLLRKLNVFYVEIVRNTPVLLQLVFWYFVVFFGLSQNAQVAQLPGSVMVSKKGIWLPWPVNTPQAWISGTVIIGLAIAAFLLWHWRIRVMEQQGASGQPQQFALMGVGAIALLIFIFGLGWEFPKVDGTNVNGGLRLSLEYAAMLMGLSFHKGAFIAEIVRAGIQSVSKGQWEAARALGLHTGIAMRLVVFPQALRVIIPSLNSQYITLTKDSSLALAIGYPDTFATAQTTLNQTGRAVEVILLIVATYLTINLLTSIVMNVLNRAVQIKER
jgi:general L-amino acid transport system permease protein